MNSKKKNMLLMIIFGLLLLCIIISASYAYFLVNTSYSQTLSTVSGQLECLNITYSETKGSQSDYNNKYPITDDYALTNNHVIPVTATITNTCTNTQDPINYVFTYTSLSENTGYIPDTKMRLAVNKKIGSAAEGRIINPTYVSNLESLTSGPTYTMLMSDLANRQNVSTFTNKTNYVIDRNTIESNQTIIYKVYVWIDQYEGDTTHTGLYDNSTEGLTYANALSVVINSERIIPASETLIALSNTLNDSTKIQKYTGKVTDRWQDYGANAPDASNVYIIKSNDINNVIFGGYCWLIIRTTETGGVKLLYNGIPNNGVCNNTGYNTMLTASQMGTASSRITFSQGGAWNKAAYVGYMYNPYTITGTYGDQLIANNVNTNDSLLKEKTEYWFANSGISENLLEDAVYCNDRSQASGEIYVDQGYEAQNSYSSSSGDFLFVNYLNSNTSLECTYQTDSFSKGNSLAPLNYKVGFLTIVELNKIQNIFNVDDIIDVNYWLGSPSDIWSPDARVRVAEGYGGEACNVSEVYGVRPVVSVASTVQITGGEGSTTDPFIFR